MATAAGTQSLTVERSAATGLQPGCVDSSLAWRILRARGSLALFLIVGAVLALSVFLSAFQGTGPDGLLGEWTMATFLSAGMMIACACLLAAIYWRRRRAFGHPRRATLLRPSLIWPVMAVGFLFLAADEIFEFHERFDLLLHTAFSLRETPLTDRIDDGIVLMYGVVGLALLSRARSELALFRGAWPLLRLALLLLFAMVIVDLLTNRWFAPAGIDPESTTIRALAGWGVVAEESLKLFSGALFVIAFAVVARAATPTGPPHRERPAC